jgi:hypothetical protein
MLDINQLDRRRFLHALTAAGTTPMLAVPALAEADQDQSGLLVGAGIAEITAPLEVGILMSSGAGRWEPFEGVRLPLEARAAVFEQRNRASRW